MWLKFITPHKYICIIFLTHGIIVEFLIDTVDNSKDQEDKADEYKVATGGGIVAECNKRLHKLRINCIATSISSLQLIKVNNAMAKQHCKKKNIPLDFLFRKN